MVKKWLKAISLLALLVVPGDAAWAQKPAIKVGVLYPITGAYAGPAKDGINGVKRAFDEVNNEIAGRKVELLKDVEQYWPKGRPAR